MTAAVHTPHTFRIRPIDPTGAERIGTPGKRHRPPRGALLAEAVWASGELGITIYSVTADAAVQEWERES